MDGEGGWFENFGRIAWFSGGTKGRLVVADRVQRKDYRKLTASEGGGGGVIRVRHILEILTGPQNIRDI